MMLGWLAVAVLVVLLGLAVAVVVHLVVANVNAVRSPLSVPTPLAVLGVREHWWLDYEDGKCAEAEAEAAVRVREIVEAFRPDTILTFGPDGYTGHPDHRAMCRWTAQAVRGLGRAVRVLWVAVEVEQYEELREADEAANIFFEARRPPLVMSADCAIDFRLPAEWRLSDNVVPPRSARDARPSARVPGTGGGLSSPRFGGAYRAADGPRYVGVLAHYPLPVVMEQDFALFVGDGELAIHEVSGHELHLMEAGYIHKEDGAAAVVGVRLALPAVGLNGVSGVVGKEGPGVGSDPGVVPDIGAALVPVGFEQDVAYLLSVTGGWLGTGLGRPGPNACVGHGADYDEGSEDRGGE
jgi:hypothetical protein